MPIDSDISNADAHLHVEFYENERKEYAGQTFCKIIVPGDKTFQWDQPVREIDKQRFPRHWLFYQMKKTEGQVFGTPLAEWAAAVPDDAALGHQIAELHLLKFQSVEQVSNMTDTQVQKVGMGAAGLRERARAYLGSKNTTQTNEDRTKLEKAEKQVEFLSTQMAALIEHMNNQPEPVQAAAPKRRGPKPGFKRKAVADVVHHAPTGDTGNQ